MSCCGDVCFPLRARASEALPRVANLHPHIPCPLDAALQVQALTFLATSCTTLRKRAAS